MAINLVRLLANVDIKNDYRHSFTFATSGEQASFFSGKSVNTINNVTYVKKEQAFRYHGPADEIDNVSYLMYQNTEHTDKWYYAFVTGVRYVNDECSYIDFEIDSVQTWYFEMDIKDSFIEREHVSDDTIGLHTIDENLNTGQYRIQDKEDVNELDDLYFVIGTTINDVFSPAYGDIYNGVYGGLAYYAFVDELEVNTFLQAYAGAGKSEGIKVIFTIPQAVISDVDPTTKRIDSQIGISVLKNFTKNLVNLDGYVPKNNKMFTFPYNFLEIINNQGAQTIYNYEDFSFSDCRFTIQSDLAPNPTVGLYPLGYNNTSINQSEGMTLSGFPLCSFPGDLYANWLAQNQVSNTIGIGGSLLSFGVGVATANPIAIAGGVLGVASQIGNFVEKSILPNPLNGSSSGSLNIASGTQTFTAYKKTVKAEFAKLIDGFFTMFGYKVNRVGTPTLKTRQSFNYLKLREPNIFGNFNNEHLKVITDAFERGITFWHIDDVGNYDLSNNPL